ncbi:uncharacterized protein BX664DRAFT_343837 [Halteromyces radiatus]|uniref:uncharacterized protein n=1 Tax=Halteromyces radiatus TaxID=101107 RepID=UPI00221F4C65|nr:uncharacterized protein BX664DRAFT_343837 [Halteromyces radiatus]KAI8076753.1 hypothetical protein BX664DRAFT_343837 [Halteromyces radiatus]
MPTSIYISGVTGYIGGAVVSKLLASKKKYKLTALVRSQDKAIALEQAGIRTVIGSLEDSKLIEDLVFEHDVTITAANCDSLTEAQAVVKGMQRKHDLGQRGLLVQTTGSGVVTTTLSDGHAMKEENNVFSDLDTARLNALPDTQPHRHVDTFLMAQSNTFDLVLIGPPTIFGKPSTTLGVNPHSMQIPWAISVSLQHGAVHQVGDGKNTWSLVHIDDLVDLYGLVIDQWLDGQLDHFGYFFPESGFYEWQQAYQVMAKTLHALGAIPSPLPIIIRSDDEFIRVYKMLAFKFAYGGNTRVSADKCRAIGWSPKYSLDDFLLDIEREAGVLARKKGFIP